MEKISVLDHGYVRLVDHLGNDLTVANTARTSFAKESAVLTEKDEKLINYLVKHKHDSCLRHNVMTFEVYAPLMVTRQWQKHIVASTHADEQLGWNEESRRYVNHGEEFYVPSEFLGVPENKKQGASGPVSTELNEAHRSMLVRHQQLSLELYQAAMDNGIAPEQARLFLPAYGLYVHWRWTASLNAIFNFLDLRLDEHAQHEIRLYAQAIEPMVAEKFPITYGAWQQRQ